jgi:predicted nucleotidyltransferase
MQRTSFIEQVSNVNQAAWTVYNANPLHTKKVNMSPADIVSLFESLQRNKVQYILIGGFAMAFHGHVRATDDIDLWIKNEPANMDNLKRALVEIGISEVQWMRNTTQLVEGITMFTLLNSDLTIDLMHNLKLFKETDFDNCFIKAKVGTYQGFEVPILQAEDLLHEKIATSRVKDISDIIFLAKKTNYKGLAIDPAKFKDLDGLRE